MYQPVKKLKLNNEKSTPKARADRLKRVRNLANLDRKQMCDDGTINFNTLKGWENAKYGGLPVDGAEKIIYRIAREGVICSTDWLLYELGTPPTLSSVNLNKTATPLSTNADHDKQERNALEAELAAFQSYYHDISCIVVEDDGMEPIYRKGDQVAGKNYYHDDIQQLVGKNCIVKMDHGIQLLRHIKTRDKDGLYTLVCINSLANVTEPTIYHAKILTAAAVMRHYYATK